jgi:ribosomal protein S18 acetylase RimI-like enzyme
VSTSSVLSLRHEDVDRAGNLIARAFHEDPLNVHLYPDEAARARLAPSMLAAFVRFDHLFGQVDHLPGFTAVASWSRPGTIETAERMEQAGFDDLSHEQPLAALDAVFGHVGPSIAEVAPEPHWHLRLLAVDPSCQGRGLGAILLRHGLDRATETSHSVVLETFAERAVPFYRRNGFEIIVDAVEPVSGLRYWALRHMP